MKLIRFMGVVECASLMAGNSVENHKDFSKYRSTSKGFCFIDADKYGDDLNEHARYMAGVVDSGMAIIAKVKPKYEKMFKKTKGSYRDTSKTDGIEDIMAFTDKMMKVLAGKKDFQEVIEESTVWKQEFCTEKYSLDMFSEVRIVKPDTWKNGKLGIDDYKKGSVDIDYNRMKKRTKKELLYSVKALGAISDMAKREKGWK